MHRSSSTKRDTNNGEHEPVQSDHKEMDLENGNPAEAIPEALRKCHVTDCGITDIDVDGDTAYYHMTCVINSLSLKWTFRIRYRYFHVLFKALEKVWMFRSSFEDPLPPFPKKKSKIFTNHLNVHFIRQRRVLIDNFLHKIVNAKHLNQSQVFMEFCMPGEHVTGTPEISLYNPTRDNVFSWELKDQLTDTGIEDEDIEPFEVTAVKITHAQILRHNHVIYQIDVTNKLKEGQFSSWVVLKRFDEFCKLSSSLRRDLKDRPDLLGELPNLPPKKMKLFTDHFDPTFIEERKILLESFLRLLISTPQVRTHTYVLHFLGI